MAASKKSRYCSPCCPLRSTVDFFAAAMPSLLGTARGSVTLLFLHLIMENIQEDAIVTGRLSEAESMPIVKAARALGLDAYTLCTFIQRGQVQAGLSASGEFVVPTSEVERLAKKE
jgi:hypothetical protein